MKDLVFIMIKISTYKRYDMGLAENRANTV